ncbi:unnamed protein product [Penicillium egyptiacum]|uniref:Uncharacterized protein n=1 Tax=Penicillium egyptiacum TaxID=1303716 RepID=A0A9W4P687_9EURO|nr:unnamed protein product [Penicillium egyptiacum]
MLVVLNLRISAMKRKSQQRLHGLTVVPGLTQRPIQPGHSWTYRWTASQYGTYWYHPTLGVTCPMASTGPFGSIFWAFRNSSYRSDLYGKMLTISSCSDRVLINGRGAVYCAGAEKVSSVELSYLKSSIGNQPLTDKRCLPNVYETQGNFPPTYEDKIPAGLNSGCTPTTGLHETIEVDPNAGWVSLKFISAASIKALMFSIDEHPMYVYEVDGNYVEPQLAESMNIFSGERSAVMIKLDKDLKEYTIRDTPSQPYVDYGGRNTSTSVVALEIKGIKNYPAVTIPQTADQLLTGTTRLSITSTKNNLEPQVTIQTKNGTWVDLLLQLGEMPNSPAIQAPHVMHKHSDKGFILGVGPGTSWMMVRYQVVNPGLFLFHCHIHTHMANGMAVALLDGIEVWPPVPKGEDQSPQPWTHG